MGSWRNHRSPTLRQGEADGMLDLTRSYFVIANQAGKNRQAGGIGGRPCPGTLLVGQQVPNRGRVGIPATVAVRNGVEEFVQEAVAAIQYQHVAITTARVGVSLNRSVARDGHRTRIAGPAARATSAAACACSAR